MSVSDPLFIFLVISVAIIVIPWAIITHQDEICGFFEDLWHAFETWFDTHTVNSPLDILNPPVTRHHSKRKWKLFSRFLLHRRRKWVEKADGWRANRKCEDILAESLATHEDIVEAMYGESPSMWQVYHDVKEWYKE